MGLTSNLKTKSRSSKIYSGLTLRLYNTGRQTYKPKKKKYTHIKMLFICELLMLILCVWQ